MKTSLSRTVVSSVLACLLLLLALPFMALPVLAAPQAGVPDIASIDAYISAQMQANHIPGMALGLVHNDQVVHLRGFGRADQSGRVVTPQTPFLIGSLTKSFTAMAIMQLVEAGKIDLDAPVQRYLPWFRVADATASAHITVRQLLNHTSGLPTALNGTQNSGLATMTLEQFVRGMSKVALDRPVGSSFEYANTGYMVLGLIVQTVSGEEYGTFIQQHILAPLHMQHSYVSLQEARQNGMVQGYEWFYGVAFPTDDPDLHIPSLLPAGLLISSAQDMSHYLIAQMNNGRYGSTSVLSPKGIATMHAPAAPEVVEAYGPNTAYGMGWFNGPINGVPAVWHDGITPTSHAFMVIEPQIHWGAILLVNANNFLVNSLTFQHIQAGVAGLLAGHEPPQTSLNLTTLYLIIDGIIVLISALVLWPLLRLPWWYKRFQQRPRHRVLRLALPLARELILPVLILIVPSWPSLLFYYPDIGWWLAGIIALLFITAIIRIVLAFLALRKKSVEVLSTTPSPTQVSRKPSHERGSSAILTIRRLPPQPPV